MEFKSKNYIKFLEIKDAVAHYMVHYEKDYIKHDELKNLMYFIQAELTKKGIHSTVLFSNVYIKDFKDDYQKYFTVTKDFIVKNDNVTYDDLRKKILAYTNIDILITMIETCDKFDRLNKKISKEISYEVSD